MSPGRRCFIHGCDGNLLNSLFTSDSLPLKKHRVCSAMLAADAPEEFALFIGGAVVILARVNDLMPPDELATLFAHDSTPCQMRAQELHRAVGTDCPWHLLECPLDARTVLLNLS